MTANIPILSYAEAEAVAEAIALRWTGVTGQQTPPPTFQIADLVQLVLRKGQEIAAARQPEGGDL